MPQSGKGMSQRFQRAFTAVMGREGGWADNPADHGGETYKGIARKFWASWPGWAIVDVIKGDYRATAPRFGCPGYKTYAADLSKRLADHSGLQYLVEIFYWKNFWLAAYDSLSYEPLAVWLFDKGVNMGLSGGKSRAHRWLQEALAVTVDGLIGPQTIRAVNSHPEPARLLEEAREKAREYYRSLARHDPSQAQFLAGWLARA